MVLRLLTLLVLSLGCRGTLWRGCHSMARSAVLLFLVVAAVGE